MSGAAATAGKRGVSLGAGVLQRWRHSMDSDLNKPRLPAKILPLR